ncbi:MAG: hypothetical protein FD161_4938, partial [Limisphaerales bacterium]
ASMGPPRFSGGVKLAEQLERTFPLASMGPPRFSGGVVVGPGLVGTHQPASMGPPRFSGGVRRHSEQLRRHRAASMGPPRFSGGVTATRRAGCASTVCFNGAAAFQRRSCIGRYIKVASDRVLQWGRRVSAAELVGQADHPLAHRSASMGPPRFSGGVARVHLDPSRRTSRFNGAAPLCQREVRHLPAWKLMYEGEEAAGT